jgi:voltage-gated potassium channel Kch
MAGQLGVFTDAIAQPLKAAVALSMALTPLLLVFNDRLLQPRFAAKPSKSREPDAVESHDNPVVLAGFGRFGHIVGRLLRANGFGVTVLDSDPDQIESLARFGIKSYYGDASRPDLLAAAGAAKARLFICAVDNTEKSLQIVDLVRHEFPNLQILARATSRAHAYELIRRGVHLFQRDTLGSAIHLSVDALQALGFPEDRAVRAGLIFHEHEQRSVREMAAHYGTDEEKYVSVARQHIQALEAVLHADQRDHSSKPAETPDSAKPH